jgi:hypothetical protein
VRHERLMQLKPKADLMLSSVINEKRGMEWPTTGRNLKLFNIIKTALSKGIRR